MRSDPLLVTAWLSSPLAMSPSGPPQLDSLLEIASSVNCDPRKGQGVEKERLTRAEPPPEQGSIHIPLAREWLGPWLVARCSSPILPVGKEDVDYVGKKIAVEEADLLREKDRKVISTANSWTKSYRLPLRVLAVDRVCWFAVGDCGGVHYLLSKRIHAVGKKVVDGYGIVRKWAVDRIGEDNAWFAANHAGTVLMRIMPIGQWLPPDLLGFRRDYAACVGPYWHPARYTEVVSPC